MEIRSRIAPTPSGFLHLGNAFSFVLTWLLVRQKNGTLFLRIDDLDAARLRKEYLDDIFFTLDWLKIDYDQGASGTEDFLKNFSQQHRIAHYQNFLDKLKAKGLLYACQCSRKQLRQQDAQGIYTKNCRHKNLDFQQQAWRIALPTPCLVRIREQGKDEFFELNQMGDFVVRRKDGLPAYQISSLVDDLENKINFIVRGRDLWASTAAQIFLAQQQGLTAFQNVDFLHHSLIYDHNGLKLSKSAGAESLREIRTKQSPEYFYRFFSQKMGLPYLANNSTELLDIFCQNHFNFSF